MKQLNSSLDSQEGLLWLLLLVMPLAIAIFQGIGTGDLPRKPVEISAAPPYLAQKIAVVNVEPVKSVPITIKPEAIISAPNLDVTSPKIGSLEPKTPPQKNLSWGFVDVSELQKYEKSFSCPISINSQIYIDRVASFNPGKTTVELADQVKLKRLGNLFLQCPGKLAIQFVGFADAAPIQFSAASSNEELSRKRAASVQRVLSNIPLNIHSSNIQTEIQGVSRNPDNDKNHPRRVGLLISSVIN